MSLSLGSIWSNNTNKKINISTKSRVQKVLTVNRPIKVKVPLYTINPQLEIINENTCDLLWKDFIYLLKTLYREDIDAHRK